MDTLGGTQHFNPLPPYGGRLHGVCRHLRVIRISIHSLRMEGDYVPIYDRIVGNISIHSLRMEGDPQESHICRENRVISIHSLRMEGDYNENQFTGEFLAFQSTPSVWRETRQLCAYIIAAHNFNPLPPYGGRRCHDRILPAAVDFNPLPPYGGRRIVSRCSPSSSCISIHSLRMEGDPVEETINNCDDLFQSTPSVWRETMFTTRERAFGNHFNPLPPYGGRRLSPATIIRQFVISIHSLRMEGDPQSLPHNSGNNYFNPLPPYGGRLQNWQASA